jgi:hypothetical protein
MKLKKITAPDGEVIDLSTLKHDSVIIVRGVTDRHQHEKVIRDLQHVVRVNAAFLIFGNQKSAGVEIVPEEKMNELGWHRRKWKDRLDRFVHRIKKAVQGHLATKRT